MSRLFYILLLLTPLLAPPVTLGQEGKLGPGARDVREKRDDHEDDTKDEKEEDCKNRRSSDSEEGCNALGTLVFWGACTPFVVPHLAVEDDLAVPMVFPSHPYASQTDGYMRFERGPGVEGNDGEGLPWLKPWSLRLSVEEANDFDGLNRVGGRVLFETRSRFGIQGGWDVFHERLDCGCVDTLGMGDLNLVFRFAQCEQAQFRAGVGVRVLGDSNATDVGFNFTYGGDWYLARPLIISWSLDAGTLGETGVFRGRATLGAAFHGWELFGGYDFLRIGTVNLQGPLVGLRVWF